VCEPRSGYITTYIVTGGRVIRSAQFEPRMKTIHKVTLVGIITFVMYGYIIVFPRIGIAMEETPEHHTYASAYAQVKGKLTTLEGRHVACTQLVS
jgi:hypothetical protein